MNAKEFKNYLIGSWKIEKDGTMVHQDTNYYIEGDRLSEDNWIQHMAEKKWVDLRQFVRAYLLACQVRGIKSVKISTSKMW